MNCRFCENELKYIFVDLGYSPPSNSYLSSDQLTQNEVYYPLKVYVCENCFLVQLDEYKKASEIFNEDYAYFSSISKAWLGHAKTYTLKMMSEFGVYSGSSVMEIASNDGYLLQYFQESGIKVLGIEPTASTANVAREKGIETIEVFFGASTASQIIEVYGKADLLLGNNVLAHVPDINDFVEGLNIVLADDGLITMEFPHLLQLVENNQFDTIYHEHFSYLSFTIVKKIFERHELALFHVEELSTHGGSLRIFAKHTNSLCNPVRDSVNWMLSKEEKAGMGQIHFYMNFEKKVSIVKSAFIDFLINAKREGKKIGAYGAAAKGNTMLNACGVKNNLIEFVVDAAKSKQGKYMPGSHIPIVEESIIRQSKPDYIVIFPWNIKEEIINNLSYIMEWNAKFVVTIPKLQVL